MKTEKESRMTKKLKSGGQEKHGGYTFMVKGELPESRRGTRILRYLTNARAGLVSDLGPTEDDLTTAQIILIDRVVSKLGVVRLIEEHIKDNAVMKGEDVAPSLKASYLAYNNSIRLDLERLGIDKKRGAKEPGVQDYIKQFDEAKDKKGKKK